MPQTAEQAPADPRDRSSGGVADRPGTTTGGARTAAPLMTWRWLVVALAAGILLGFGAVQLIDALTRPLLVLVLGITLASTLAPLVRRLDTHMPRAVAITVVYLVLAALIALFAWYIAPTVAQQGRELLAQLPQLTGQLQQRVQNFVPAGIQLDQAVSAATQSLGARSAALLTSFLTGAFEILVIIFLAAYFLMVGERFHRFALHLAVGTNRRRTSRILSRMSHAMGGYFRGAVIDGVIIGALTWITLLAIGRPFAAPLALLAALGELVPYIGPIVAAVPAIALALLDSPQQALIVAVAYVAIQQIEGHLVTPLVMHTQTDITPATVLFAVVAGWAVAGVLGAIAAVPIFAAVRVLVVWVVLPRARCREQRLARQRTA